MNSEQDRQYIEIVKKSFAAYQDLKSRHLEDAISHLLPFAIGTLEPLDLTLEDALYFYSLFTKNKYLTYFCEKWRKLIIGIIVSKGLENDPVEYSRALNNYNYENINNEHIEMLYLHYLSRSDTTIENLLVILEKLDKVVIENAVDLAQLSKELIDKSVDLAQTNRAIASISRKYLPESNLNPNMQYNMGVNKGSIAVLMLLSNIDIENLSTQDLSELFSNLKSFPKIQTEILKPFFTRKDITHKHLMTVLNNANKYLIDIIPLVEKFIDDSEKSFEEILQICDFLANSVMKVQKTDITEKVYSLVQRLANEIDLLENISQQQLLDGMLDYDWSKTPKVFHAMYSKLDKTNLSIITDLLIPSKSSESTEIMSTLLSGIARHPDTTFEQAGAILIQNQGNGNTELLARYTIFCLLGCDPTLNPICYNTSMSRSNTITRILDIFENPSNAELANRMLAWETLDPNIPPLSTIERSSIADRFLEIFT